MKSTKYLLILAAGVLLFAGGFILLRLITEPEGMMKALPFILIGIGCGTFGYGLGETAVSYTHLTDGTVEYIDNPVKLPPANELLMIEEPYVKATIMCPSEFIGAIMELSLIHISRIFIDWRKELWPRRLSC